MTIWTCHFSVAPKYILTLMIKVFRGKALYPGMSHISGHNIVMYKCRNKDALTILLYVTLNFSLYTLRTGVSISSVIQSPYGAGILLIWRSLRLSTLNTPGVNMMPWSSGNGIVPLACTNTMAPATLTAALKKSLWPMLIANSRPVFLREIELNNWIPWILWTNQPMFLDASKTNGR